MAARLRRDGVRVLTAHAASRADGGAMLFTHAGAETRVAFDGLLVAVGRRPRTRGFGLEELGVRVDEKGRVETDAHLRTSVPGIYACGDVAGPFQYTHAAADQAWTAALNALFGSLHRVRWDAAVMPNVTFTAPEVARVGLNARAARSQNIAHEVTRRELHELDRAIVDGAREGFVTILTAPGRDRILGATIVAPRAGEMLAELVVAMRHGVGLKKLFATIHAYPTYAEAIRDAAGEWRRAHAPTRLLPVLRGYHAWRRR